MKIENTVKKVNTFASRETALSVYTATVAKLLRLTPSDASILVHMQLSPTPIETSAPPAELPPAALRNALTRLASAGLVYKVKPGVYDAVEKLPANFETLTIEHVFVVPPDDYIL